MNCQNETSFLEVLKCEGTRWPLPHVLLPFIAMLYTGNMWFVVALVYFWESFEEAMWMELQSYRLLFPGTPNTRESRLNSILLDPLCGFFGIALGIWLMYFLKSHAWMFSRDRYERYVIFGGKSDSHYYLVHGMIALVFAWIIGTLLVLKVVVNVTGTAPVIFAMSLVFVFLAEMIKMLFEGEKQQRMPVVNLLKSS